MAQSNEELEYYDKNIENRLHNKYINQLILLWAILGTLIFISVQIRSSYIGWEARDIIQFLVLCCVIIVAVTRRKFSLHNKAVFLIFINLLIGVLGMVTLGLMTAAVFCMPLAFVIFSIFYSKRSLFVFLIFTVIIHIFLAVGFISGQLEIKQDLYTLHQNFGHWVVFIASFITFNLVACIAVLNYRNTSRDLVTQLSKQSERLRESNLMLNEALDEVKKLSGLLPICASCKKIRDNEGYWKQIETYIEERSEAQFTHSICDECAEKVYGELEWYKKG